MEQVKKVPKCLNPRCVNLSPFPTWKDLALHITTSDIPHSQSSRIWAAHCLADVKDKKEFGSPMPMSDELKQTVKNCVRELSGEMAKGRVKCPICGELYPTEIEIEHVQADWSWRSLEGALMINCEGCRNVLKHKEKVKV